MTDHIKKADRAAVLAEFNYCCAGCGMASADYLELDHVQCVAFFQRFRGRAVDNSPRNLQVLCGPCNKAKGDVYYMARLKPRQPVYDTREADINRANFRQMVENHKASQRLF